MPPTGFYLRVMRGDEVAAVAQICVDAFAEQNRVTGLIDEYPDGPPVDFFAASHAHPDVVTIVACDPEGRLAGTNTIDLRDTVAGIGPVAVAPAWLVRGWGVCKHASVACACGGHVSMSVYIY